MWRGGKDDKVRWDEKAKSLFKSIQESTTEGELIRMMTEEALSKDWEKQKK